MMTKDHAKRAVESQPGLLLRLTRAPNGWLIGKAIVERKNMSSLQKTVERIAARLQLLIRGSERPVHSTKQPADAKCHERSRVWLGLDCVAKPLVERDG
jgi:hypothetical protein